MKQYTDRKLTGRKRLFADIIDESEKQLEKWGLQTHSLFEWLNFTTEELGELAKAVSEFEYRKGTQEQIYKEAIQVATLSLKIAEMIKDGRNY